MTGGWNLSGNGEGVALAALVSFRLFSSSWGNIVGGSESGASEEVEPSMVDGQCE